MVRYFEHIRNCFPYPWIALKGCNQLSNSGLFINSLEGISFQRLQELQDAENVTVEKLYREIHDRSVDEVSTEFFHYLDWEKLRWNSQLEDYTLGHHGEEVRETGYDQAFIEVYKDCSDTLKAIKIDEISFISDCDADTTIYIKDGLIEHKIQVRLLGQTVNRFPLGYISFNNKVDIYIKNCENFTLYDYKNSCGCSGQCNCYICNGCFYAKSGFETDGVKTYKKNGIQINGACMCDPGKIICKYAQFLTIALRYKIGINILLEAEQKDGIGRWITSGDAIRERSLRRWRGDINEQGWEIKGEYPKNMEKTAKFLQTSLNSLESNCLNCDGYHIVN